MVAKRAYNIYLRGFGIRRMGRELKSIMNKALTHAIQQGQVVSMAPLKNHGDVAFYLSENKNRLGFGAVTIAWYPKADFLGHREPMKLVGVWYAGLTTGDNLGIDWGQTGGTIFGGF